MALNITIDGFCSLNDGTLSNVNVYYQGLFYPNNIASSPTTWSDVRIVENTGYYNINLGNEDWLTQTGVALNDDRVLVVFWSGNPDRNADCSLMDEWGAFEIILDGSSTYTNPVQTKVNIAPNLIWDLPLTGFVNTLYTATNTSHDIHDWSWNGTTMRHWYTRHNEIINAVNTIDVTDYDWGDGNQDNDLKGVADGTHRWSTAGSYEVEIVIEDKCVATVTGTKIIDIRWHSPIPNIIMTPSTPDPNTPVSFEWSGTDIDGTIVNIDWTINDSGIYGNTDTLVSGTRDETVQHIDGIGTDWCGQSGASGAFTNPGSHLVSIVYHWYDGFDWHADIYEKTFTQSRFIGPTVDFIQDPAEAVSSSDIKFTNTSSNVNRVGLGLTECKRYDWTWVDDGVYSIETDKPYSYELERVPKSGGCQVKLCAYWSDGWDTNKTCTTKDVVFRTTVTVSKEDCYYNLNLIGTSDNGSVTGYGWTVYSGTGVSGIWTETWQSPIGLEQNDKKVCFTSVGFYKIEGTVYGTGASTSDDEILHITEICPEGEIEVVDICKPDMIGHLKGTKDMHAVEVGPSMRGRMKIQPSPRVVHDDLRPFPGSRNI